MIGAIAGLLVAAGLLLLVQPLLPSRPDLDSLAARLQAGGGTATAGPAARQRRPLGAVLRSTLVERPNGLTVPAKDLAILQRSTEEFLVQKVLFALLGLFLFALLGVVGLATGQVVPGGAPAAAVGSLVAGLLFFFVPDLVYRGQATEAREDFRYALGSYLDLVALERAADGGPGQALVRAAAVGRGWAFSRISDTLTRAQLAGQAPWQGLSDLAAELGVDELGDLADVVGLAGDNSVAIYDALRAQAATLRSRERAAAEADANTQTEKMTAPATLTLVGFLLLMLYPALGLVR